MTQKKEPHETMTEKNNSLSSAQEVEYPTEFKRADNADNTKKKRTNLS